MTDPVRPGPLARPISDNTTRPAALNQTSAVGRSFIERSGIVDSSLPTDRAVGRPAPGLTLADCGMVILGAAIALSLPGDDPEAMLSMMPPWPGERWYLRLVTVANVLSGTCLALLFGVPLRVRRLGRSIRPAALLLAVVAGPMVSEAADSSPWIANSTYSVPIPGQPYTTLQLPGGPFWLSHAAVLLSGLVASIAMLLGGRQSPLVTSLFWIGVVLCYAWISAPLSQAVVAWFTLHPAPLTILQLVHRLGSMPGGLIPSLLVVLTIGDLVRRPRTLDAWDWAGITLASSWFVASRASGWFLASAFGMPASSRLRFVLLAVGSNLPLMVCAVLLLIAYRRFVDPSRRYRL